MGIRSCLSLFSKLNNIYSKIACSQTHSSPLVTLGRHFSQWDVVGAVCLERKPVLSQPLTPLEEKYLRYIRKLEVEKSFLSDHERRCIEDKRIAQKFKEGSLEDLDLVAKQTGQDFEDACLREFEKYTPASRTTDADLRNDRRSMLRCLDSSLVLVVHKRLGNELKWVLPQAVHTEGETLRQTAKRALRSVSTCRGGQVVRFMGNAPVGYYKYKYPKAVRGNGICGAKVFFFKAQLLDHREDSLVVNKTDSVEDHLWLTHSELEEVLVPVLCKAVHSFLLPDIYRVDERWEVATEEEELPISTPVANQG